MIFLENGCEKITQAAKSGHTGWGPTYCQVNIENVLLGTFYKYMQWQYILSFDYSLSMYLDFTAGRDSNPGSSDLAADARVTRLGEFSPNGRLFTLGSF
jgi:hypothetical protein